MRSFFAFALICALPLAATIAWIEPDLSILSSRE